ncbi:MAG: DUF2007 domain-containing protein [Gammaproteobacteria bacterium]|nr:DUF2007 domain-containing protein [Gammaproteobacteria bacterium]
MKKVYSHESIVTINHLRNVLEAQGVAAIVRNDRLFGVLGEVPFMECWPQLWVLNDLQADHAKQLIGAALAEPDGSDVDWTCGSCGERIEGHFAVCWQCGAQAPER